MKFVYIFAFIYLTLLTSCWTKEVKTPTLRPSLKKLTSKREKRIKKNLFREVFRVLDWKMKGSSFNLNIETDSGENPSSGKITLDDTGLMDDSLKGYRYEFKFNINDGYSELVGFANSISDFKLHRKYYICYRGKNRLIEVGKGFCP